MTGPSLAPKLEVVAGEQRGETFKLRMKTRLGRERDNEIVLIDPKISRYHAQITLEGGQWVISDLGSANGTYVNGEFVSTAQVLKAGDAISLGDTSLVLRLSSAAEEVAAAATRPVAIPAARPASPPPASEGVNTRRLVWIAGGLMLLLVLAVAVALQILALRNREDARPPGAGTGTPGQASRPPAGDWVLIFEDDFSDPNSGWDDSFDKFTTKQYGNLKYYIEVNDSNLWARGLANRDVSDFELEVEATMEGGPANNGYGLVFRFQDRDNFYRFDVSADGFFLISKFERGEWITLREWTSHPAINRGQATNVLKVSAIGPEIAVFANNQELARVRDDSLGHGNFGFFASTFSEPNLLVSFDNMKLWVPEGSRVAVIPTVTPTRAVVETAAAPATPAAEVAEAAETSPAPTSAATPTPPAGTEAIAEASPEAAITETPTAEPSATPEATSTPEPLPEYASRDQPLGHDQTPLQGRLFFPVYDPSRGTFDIYRAGANGSDRRLVISDASQPSLNAAGDQIAYRSWKGDQRGLIARPLAGGDPWRFVIFFEAARPTWAADGQFFLYHSRQSGAVPAVYRTIGEASEVLRRQGGPIQGSMPDWLPDGRFVYQGCHNGCGLVVSNLDGSFPVLLTSHESDTAPAVSPDGSQIAFMSRRDGNWEVYVIGVNGQGLTRVTNSPENDGLPTWSPDGRYLAFVSDRDGEWEMWAATPTGADQRVLFPLGGPIDGVVQIDVANSLGWTEERIDWVP